MRENYTAERRPRPFFAPFALSSCTGVGDGISETGERLSSDFDRTTSLPLALVDNDVAVGGCSEYNGNVEGKAEGSCGEDEDVFDGAVGGCWAEDDGALDRSERNLRDNFIGGLSS